MVPKHTESKEEINGGSEEEGVSQLAGWLDRLSCHRDTDCKCAVFKRTLKAIFKIFCTWCQKQDVFLLIPQYKCTFSLAQYPEGVALHKSKEEEAPRTVSSGSWHV